MNQDKSNKHQRKKHYNKKVRSPPKVIYRAIQRVEPKRSLGNRIERNLLGSRSKPQASGRITKNVAMINIYNSKAKRAKILRYNHEISKDRSQCTHQRKTPDSPMVE